VAARPVNFVISQVFGSNRCDYGRSAMEDPATVVFDGYIGNFFFLTAYKICCIVNAAGFRYYALDKNVRVCVGFVGVHLYNHVRAATKQRFSASNDRCEEL
jgi:hypothetical protein